MSRKNLLNFGKRMASKAAPAGKTALKKSGELLEKANEKTRDFAAEVNEKTKEFAAEVNESYQSAKERQAAEKAREDTFRIPPWHILAGLGSLERRALCDHLAAFECISLIKMGQDAASDFWEKLKKSDPAERERAFLARIRNASDEYYAETGPRHSDAWLRFRMWNAMRAAFGLPKTLPLSTDSANARCAEVADMAGKHYEDEDDAKGFGSKLGKFAAESPGKAAALVTRKQSDFTKAVREEARRMVLQALENDAWTEEQRLKVMEEFLRGLDSLPEDMQDQSLKQALRSGDWASVAAVGSAGTLVGLATVVEIAGFSAYIAAAKISAIIPLLGGKTAVSLLAVLANPLFFLPALAGGFVALDRGLKKKIGRMIGGQMAVLLALHGLGSRSDGLKRCLDDFKNLTDDEISDDRLVEQRETAKAHAGALPPTPGVPDADLPPLGETKDMDALMATLFPSSGNPALNVAAVAGLTAADILFDAMAIDPRVMAAADFSRAEDIDDIFKFGAFAERFESLEGVAQIGTENQLRGYVAEMMVATRLREYDVRLAETSNNPGYDLLVDGHPFQVKCYRNPESGFRALENHFGKYPDIPVYANSELASAVQDSEAPWASKVFGVEGFDYETTDKVLEQSLESGADLMDLRIPFFAVAVSAARNIHGWWKGSIPLKDIPLEVAVDGAIHGGLSAAGGIAGATLGLLLFGPAGAVIFGGGGQAGALFGAGAARRKFDDLRTREWAASTGEAADAFRVALDEAMQSKIRRIHSRATEIEVPDPALQHWARLKFADRALCVAECRAELDCLPDHPVDRTKELLALMRRAGVHPLSVNEPLGNLMNILAEKPRVADQAKEMVDQAGTAAKDSMARVLDKGKKWRAERRSGDAS